MKVLVLSCNTGEGHNSAARAVVEAFEGRGIPCELADALRFAGKRPSQLVSNTYSRIVTHVPRVFGWMYRAGGAISATRFTSPIYYANIIYAKNLLNHIREGGFDTIICTHLFPMETLTRIRQKGELDAPCYGIFTDYTCIPFIKETDMDAYMVPHEKIVAESVTRGMAREKLLVTGLPVAKRFAESMDKTEARRALNLPCDKRMYLIMTGGIGCGNVEELCTAILRDKGEDVEVQVLAGHNEQLRARLEEIFFDDDRVQVAPFTRQVNLYMRAADVLLTKPGGISSTEAAAVRVPMVHTMAIPGCETKNYQFFGKLGMSVYGHSPAEAASLADALVRDTARAEAMRAAQARNVDPFAAENIVERVMGR